MAFIIREPQEPDNNWIKACEHLATVWRREHIPPSFTMNDLKTMRDLELLRWASYQNPRLNQMIARILPLYTSSCMCCRDRDSINPSFRELVIQAYDWSTRVKSHIMNAVCLCQREIWRQPNSTHCPHYNIIRYSFSVEEAFDETSLSASTFKKYKQWFQDLLNKLSQEGQRKLLETQITIWNIFDPYESVYKEGMGRLDVKGLEEGDAAIILNETLPVHSNPTTIEGPFTIVDAARLKRSNKPFYLAAADLKLCYDVKLLRLAALGNTCTNKKIAHLTPRNVQCVCSSAYPCMLASEPFDWAKRVLDNDMNDICHFMADSLPPNVKSILCPHKNIMMLEYPNSSILNDSITGFWLEMDQFQAYKRILNEILSHLSEEGQKIVCNHSCRFWLAWDSKDKAMILLWDNSEIEGLGRDDTLWIKSHLPFPMEGMVNTWWAKLFPSICQAAKIVNVQRTISRADMSVKNPFDEVIEIWNTL